MKLYIVEEVDGEWCIFVFAERANKEQVIVDDERHPLYPIVREFGGGFTDHNGEILEAEEQQ